MILFATFPRVYALYLHRHDSISDKMSMGLRVNTLRRIRRGRAEQEQWDNFTLPL